MIDIKLLVSQGEGYNLEFKESFTANIAKDICAFANANGGQILLGITDDGKTKELNINNSLRSQVQDLARNLDPALNIEIEQADNVLLIKVPEGIDKPYSANGKFFLRYGPNSQQLSRAEIRSFFQAEGHILFDEKLNPHFKLDKDLNNEKFAEFVKKAQISPLLSKKQILENLYLIKAGQLKNAGVLLFCRQVDKFFAQAKITCVLYQGNTKYKILDRKDFDEDIFSNYQNTIIYLQSKLNTEYIIKGGPREEKLELPENALREAVLNAIAHRNYFVAGANILVEIFSDRVEITNPGGLVKGLSRKNLGKKSLSRNNLLFGLMQRMGLVEKVGSGITRMRNAMKVSGLKPLEFDIDENWFSIIFKRPQIKEIETPPSLDLNERQKKALEYVRNKGKITNKEYQDLNTATRITAVRDLAFLVDNKIFIKQGKGRSVSYVLFQ